MLQRLRDAEDDIKFGEFSGKEGDIISGVIQQGRDPQDVLVDLGRLEALLPSGERVPGEGYEHGTRIKCLVISVRKGMRGPQVMLSRSHPNLVKKLFALEVPEIADGTVEICGDRPRGRPPHQDRGAHEGPRRERQGLLHRADGPAGPRGDERAARREDRHRRLLRGPGRAGRRTPCRPARVSSVEVVDLAARSARVVVPDYQLSLAIGKEGQNARLAARLTGWRIDIRSDEAPAEPAIAPVVRRRRRWRARTDAGSALGPSDARLVGGSPPQPEGPCDRMSTDSISGPARTCVGCRKRAAKHELLRVVAGERGHGLEVVPDPSGRAPGRGRTCTPPPSAWSSPSAVERFPGPSRSQGRARHDGGRGPCRQHSTRSTSTDRDDRQKLEQQLMSTR